jgi:thioredoxin-dependent peroxiredoxin
LLRFERIAPVSRDVRGCLNKPKRENVMMIQSMGRRLAILGLSVLTVMIIAGAAAAELKVGDPAPPFSLKGSDGQTYTLDQFKGKSAVVVAWFPKAFTGGCTKECKSLRENSKPLHDLKVAYFTASVDTPELNEKFAKSLDLDYPILSDPDKIVAKEYGVLNPERGFANRWTFYIGKDGLIKEIDKKVNAPQAGPDIAAKLKELGLVAE